MSYRLRKIYECDCCGKISLPMIEADSQGTYKTLPEGWIVMSRKEHYCGACAKALAELRGKYNA